MFTPFPYFQVPRWKLFYFQDGGERFVSISETVVPHSQIHGLLAVNVILIENQTANCIFMTYVGSDVNHLQYQDPPLDCKLCLESELLS
jgi:hypothetical protein